MLHTKKRNLVVMYFELRNVFYSSILEFNEDDETSNK